MQQADLPGGLANLLHLTANNMMVEVHNSIEHVFYICHLPRTSSILVLQNCTDCKDTIAAIRIQADSPEKQWLRISFVRRSHKDTLK